MPGTWAWTPTGSAGRSPAAPTPPRSRVTCGKGVRNGVNATPKFYVDGERIDGKFPLEGLEDAIRASVRAAGAG